MYQVPRSSLSRRGRTLRSVLSLLFILFTSASVDCCDCDEGDNPLRPLIRMRHWEELELAREKVGGIEVVPGKVYSRWGTEFLLEARVLDENGDGITGAFPDITWSKTGDIGLFRPSGDSVRVTVPEWDLNAALSSNPVGTVTAHIDDHSSDPVEIHTTRHWREQEGGQGPIYISIPHSPGGFVPLVMMDAKLPAPPPIGTTTGGGFYEHQDMIVGVAGFGVLTRTFRPPVDLEGPEVVVLSESNAPQFQDMGLPLSGTPIAEVLPQEPALSDRKIEALYSGTASLTLKLWGGVPGGDVELTMTQHAAVAKDILRRSRVGIDLDWDVVQANRATAFNVPSGACYGWDWAPADLQNEEPAAGEVLVVYAGWLGGSLGRSCSYETDRFGTIFIDFDKASVTTLTHELGHLLGMGGSYTEHLGHTNTVDGTNCSNPMRNSSDDECLANAERFSLGQAFRMGWDDRSFLRFGTTLPGQSCQEKARENKPCPCIATDFVSAGASGAYSSCAQFQPFLKGEGSDD